MNEQMRNLAISVSDMINDHIARGMTTEEVCGVLDVASFRVKQASTLPETESGGGGGGSPVSLKTDYRKETSPEQVEDI